MNHPFNQTFLLLFLLSCSAQSVEQIPVKTPKGLIVPPEMVYIPKGEFFMGDINQPNTARGKKVYLRAFLIDRFEVSHGEYESFQPNHRYISPRKKFPITHLNYMEAEVYCKSKGKRLPTESEWEKAARGLDRRKWPWKFFYEHPNNGFSGFLAEPVDKRREWISPYGLYGMGHNVWEWTSTWYNYQKTTDLNQKIFKVIRGGLIQTHLKIEFSPTWFRNYMKPDSKLNFIGFRCARDSKL